MPFAEGLRTAVIVEELPPVEGGTTILYSVAYSWVYSGHGKEMRLSVINSIFQSLCTEV